MHIRITWRRKKAAQINIYYSNENGSNTVYIDNGSKQMRIHLPKQYKEIEAETFVSLPVTKYILTKLLNSKETEQND